METPCLRVATTRLRLVPAALRRAVTSMEARSTRADQRSRRMRAPPGASSGGQGCCDAIAEAGLSEVVNAETNRDAIGEDKTGAYLRLPRNFRKLYLKEHISCFCAVRATLLL
mmetsp:Transcript_15553/g.41841  ORF Transcript_15553/g.41841 Transcript_15553/m.41841 type:complete len:113 (+) Transcript_15553:105-443(+)